jgi:RimJ/RimL family protein N-acetyltransferase
MNGDVYLQPTLIGERVIVRPIVAGNRQGMFAAAADPKIWEVHPDSNRYEEGVFRMYFDAALASGSAFSFVDKKSNDIIGSSRFYGHNPVASEIKIDWTFLSRDYWGGSYNAEIKQLLLIHAFTFVDTVVFWVGETNTRSRRAMEKIGAVLRPGVQHRDVAGDAPYAVYEIKNRGSKTSA